MHLGHSAAWLQAHPRQGCARGAAQSTHVTSISWDPKAAAEQYFDDKHALRTLHNMQTGCVEIQHAQLSPRTHAQGKLWTAPVCPNNIMER